MKNLWIFFVVILLVVLSIISYDHIQSFSQSQIKTIISFNQLKGPYLGQKLPTSTPEIFAQKLISRGFHELGIALSSDGEEIFYIMSDRGYQHYSLVHILRVDGIWTKPQLAKFATKMSVYTCFFAPDGDTFYFSTNRPVIYESDTLKGTQNWCVKKIEGQWQTAKLIDAPLDLEKKDRIHSISKFNNLYLTRELADGNTEIFVSHWENSQFQKPQPIKGLVNSRYGEGRPFVAPDESCLIFQSDREKGYGSNDLWISFKDSNNQWSGPVNLDGNINTASSEFGPVLSPDGKYLFFSSYRPFDPELLKNKTYNELLALYSSPQNGYATLYWVDAKIFKELKSQD